MIPPLTLDEGVISLKKKRFTNPFVVDKFGGPLKRDVTAPGLFNEEYGEE